MVLRFVGLIGLMLLPGVASASGAGVHQALEGWIRTGGAAGVAYSPVNAREAPEDLPGWLLAPRSASNVSAHLLDRGVYPEATTLAWDPEQGAVRVYGALAGQPGLRLVADRDRQRPLALRTAAGVRWVFSDYRHRGDRRQAVPGRLTRITPEGGEIVLTPR